MTSLNCYSTLLTPSQLRILRDCQIKTVLDFILETPDNLSKIVNLRFKDILEVKETLLRSFRGSSYSGLQLHHKIINNCCTLLSGIPELDKLTGGFQPSCSYEIYGLSASGKTHICLHIIAEASYRGFKVHFIDTKNEFSPIKVYRMLYKYHESKEKTIADLNRIIVTQVTDLYCLISLLHKLKNILINEHIPLIVIDCLSTLYFLTVGSDEPIGIGLLNHIASLIKYITTEFHVIFIVTNLATKYYKENENFRKKTKPCLGNYWSQVCDFRIDLNALTRVDLS